jgi:hypothetical protein
MPPMKTSIIIFSCILLMQVSCRQKSGDEWTITQRIQYDVSIKSPDPNLEWWVQNIEGMNRESFISDLLEAAYNGDIETWDPFLLTQTGSDQIKRIGSRSDTMRLQRTQAPYTYYDTVIIKEISIHDITRIRFLEEWKQNKQNKQIKKEVLGIAPMLENYDETGNLRGYQPMFWIFFDDAYPGPLQRKAL